MKPKKLLIFPLFFLCIFSLFPYSQSYYGDGDCTEYHTGEIIKVPFDPSAKIQLDGIANETFWEDNANKEGRTQINVSTFNSTTTNPEIITLNMSFIRNNYYFLILCEWPDSSTLPNSIKDGIFFCWNINVPNFTAYYPGGMQTDHMGGGYIDSWMWTINNDSPANDSNDYCKDSSFGPGGDTGENDQITIEIGYTTIVDSHYTIEFRRKLTTNEKNLDVQFDKSKKYEFNLGLLNNSAFNHDHAISYTHALDIRFKEDEIINGFQLIPFFIGIFSVSLILNLQIIKKLKK